MFDDKKMALEEELVFIGFSFLNNDDDNNDNDNDNDNVNSREVMKLLRG